MKKMVITSVVGALIAAASVASAVASRVPTAEEHAALAATANTVAACVDVRVATVQAGWARLELTNAEGCPQGNGVAILQFTNGRWATRYEGSDDLGGPCSGFAGVPAAVALDLGVCRPLSERVYIPRGDDVVYKPRLMIYGAHAGLRNLRWSGWGRAVATSRGTLDYADRTLSFRAPIRVRVSRIRPCGVRRTYRRMSVTFVRANHRRMYGALDGVTSFVCP